MDLVRYLQLCGPLYFITAGPFIPLIYGLAQEHGSETSTKYSVIPFVNLGEYTIEDQTLFSSALTLMHEIPGLITLLLVSSNVLY